MNYLLYRVYESAKQLKRSDATTRIALIVIDGLTSYTFGIQLKEGWIDWKNQTFMDVYDPFIEDQRGKIPNLDAELKSALACLDDVWILERSNGNQLVKVFQRGE